MEAGKKIRIQPIVDSEIADKLQIEAAENGHKVGPYAAHLLTQHVKKNELPKPFVKKQEYGS